MAEKETRHAPPNPEEVLPIDCVLIGLARECPFGGNPPDCQLHWLRQRAMVERLTYIRSLTAEEKQAVLAHHRACFERNA